MVLRRGLIAFSSVKQIVRFHNRRQGKRGAATTKQGKCYSPRSTRRARSDCDYRTLRVLRITYSAEFAGLAQNLGRRTTEGTEDTEKKAEEKRLMKITFRTPLSFLCDLCVLCGELSEFFGCGVAALCPSWRTFLRPVKLACGSSVKYCWQPTSKIN